jgi:hypothetical protein
MVWLSFKDSVGIERLTDRRDGLLYSFCSYDDGLRQCTLSCVLRGLRSSNHYFIHCTPAIT